MNKFYITTAIYYVNGAPHIGHAIQNVWADIIARYHCIKGDDVFFLTGTDEHGVNIVRTAEGLGKTPKKLADENASKFKGLKEVLNLSWNDFIRTSDQKRHWPGAIAIWKKLKESGDLYKKKYKGLYCASHEAFITKKDLIDGKCALHGKEPEIIEEENYFFRLSKYTDRIKKEIESNHMVIVPESRKNEILSLLNEGLEDVSFSRPAKDISWGIPVPGDPEHTMYVWCDALTNYVSALGYGTTNTALFEKYWPADVHILGKDNLRFHAAIWPGMLLSAGLLLPKTIFCHGFITVNGQKISKTLGNIIDPVELTKQYGTDAIRFYFAREISTYEDGDFSKNKLETLYNSELINNLGNLVSRFFGAAKKFNKIPLKENKFNILAREVFENYEKAMEEFKFSEALGETFRLIKRLNQYFDEERPWEFKELNAKAQEFFSTIVLNLGQVASMLLPFLPETAEKMFKFLGFKSSGKEPWKIAETKKESQPLFKKLI